MSLSVSVSKNVLVFKSKLTFVVLSFSDSITTLPEVSERVTLLPASNDMLVSVPAPEASKVTITGESPVACVVPIVYVVSVTVVAISMVFKLVSVVMSIPVPSTNVTTPFAPSIDITPALAIGSRLTSTIPPALSVRVSVYGDVA